MLNTQKKAIIFAPFWRQTGHEGNNRMDRFVRWLSAAINMRSIYGR